MEIELWAAELTRPLTAEEDAALARLMPAERRERLDRLQDPEKRREPLCAYAMLRFALYRRLGWKEFPQIGKNSYGKPCFPEFPAVQFNLSHTKGAVLVGLHEEPLGVDIEKIRPVSERTRKRLAGVSTEKEFYESWVRREARVKREGNGVGTMLAEETPLQYGEYFHYLETFPGYVAGLSTRSAALPGKIQKFSLEDML